MYIEHSGMHITKILMYTFFQTGVWNKTTTKKTVK